MKNLNFSECTKLLKEFYDDELIQIDWGRHNQGLRVTRRAKKKLNEYDISEDSFVETAFEILYIAVSLASGTVPLSKFDEKNIDVVKEFFITPELIDEVNIKTTSFSNIINDVEYQVLTKRHKNNNKVVTYSILLELLTTDSKTNTNDRKNINHEVFELSEGDLEKLIDSLSSMLADLKTLKSDLNEKELLNI
ncbi:hypothetical protein [Piscibacillus halophilus]|uniref:hypothetical protein n=1 Tax=Piscibacillus halophilus TaxID=571933 RepID=UPI00158B46A3|nr:hypothetical protein [Piscibacillus halophilus]